MYEYIKLQVLYNFLSAFLSLYTQGAKSTNNCSRARTHTHTRARARACARASLTLPIGTNLK